LTAGVVVLEKAFSIRPMPVGAEVMDLVRGSEQDPVVRAQLYEAWLKHGILLFHNVDSIERHLLLSQCFGELELHPFAPVRSQLNPLFIELGGKKRPPAYVFDGGELRVNRIGWHRDTAYTPDICKGAVLRMVEVPAQHGETMFADTAMAYDALPADMKARLDGLEYKATLRMNPVDQTRTGAFWKTARLATPEEDPQGGDRESSDEKLTALYPSVVQPALLVHPESKRKCIFLSPTYVDYFLGMTQAQSDELLNYLVAHMLQPQFVYTHSWATDDAMLWDNRRFMHAAAGNSPDQRRFGLRTTLAGPTRTGRYFDESATRVQTQLTD
jgi:taurine dioxygenase